jgi:two-component sensor histidine kinase
MPAGKFFLGRGALCNCAYTQEINAPTPWADDFAVTKAEEFLLLREMHHRFANTFMVLTGVLRRDIAVSGSPELLESLARYEARIAAFGNLHRSLMVGAGSGWISVQGYIEGLCNALSEAILKPLGVRCVVIADTGEFPSERCERLGLVIAELVMNAAKHAFHERDDGLVQVEFINRIDSWTCIVSDDGDGTRIASPGAGSEIIKQLVLALGGNVSRKSGRNGTSVVVTCRA